MAAQRKYDGALGHEIRRGGDIGEVVDLTSERGKQQIATILSGQEINNFDISGYNWNEEMAFIRAKSLSSFNKIGEDNKEQINKFPKIKEILDRLAEYQAKSFQERLNIASEYINKGYDPKLFSIIFTTNITDIKKLINTKTTEKATGNFEKILGMNDKDIIGMIIEKLDDKPNNESKLKQDNHDVFQKITTTATFEGRKLIYESFLEEKTGIKYNYTIDILIKKGFLKSYNDLKHLNGKSLNELINADPFADRLHEKLEFIGNNYIVTDAKQLDNPILLNILFKGVYESIVFVTNSIKKQAGKIKLLITNLHKACMLSLSKGDPESIKLFFKTFSVQDIDYFETKAPTDEKNKSKKTTTITTYLTKESLINILTFGLYKKISTKTKKKKKGKISNIQLLSFINSNVKGFEKYKPNFDSFIKAFGNMTISYRQLNTQSITDTIKEGNRGIIDMFTNSHLQKDISFGFEMSLNNNENEITKTKMIKIKDMLFDAIKDLEKHKGTKEWCNWAYKNITGYIIKQFESNGKLEGRPKEELAKLFNKLVEYGKSYKDKVLLYKILEIIKYYESKEPKNTTQLHQIIDKNIENNGSISMIASSMSKKMLTYIDGKDELERQKYLKKFEKNFIRPISKLRIGKVDITEKASQEMINKLSKIQNHEGLVILMIHKTLTNKTNEIGINEIMEIYEKYKSNLLTLEYDPFEILLATLIEMRTPTMNKILNISSIGK